MLSTGQESILCEGCCAVEYSHSCHYALQELFDTRTLPTIKSITCACIVDKDRLVVGEFQCHFKRLHTLWRKHYNDIALTNVGV